MKEFLKPSFEDLSKFSKNLQTIGERWHRSSPVYPNNISLDPQNWKELNSRFCSAAFYCGQLVSNLTSGIRTEERLRETSDYISRVENTLIDMGSFFNSLKFNDFPTIPKDKCEIYERYAVDFIELISEFMVKYRKYCGLVIQRDQQSNSDSIEERLLRLEEFAIANSGVGVADYARRLFPELHRQPVTAITREHVEVPVVAPEEWPGGRGNPESPTDFIKRVYRPWLGSGLTRAHIRDLDPSLSTALDNWLRRNEMPSDIDLPTASEAARRRLGELQADPEKPTTMTLADARRFVDLERKITYRDKT